MSKENKNNNQAQISVLEFPYNVRARKGMYIPKIGYMVFEIVDNGTDEGLAGYAKNISLTMHGKNISVEDDGRGIPVTPHKDPKYQGLSQAEVAYTVLSAGGKFGSHGDGNGYGTVKTSGLNGVGGSCVNALSEWLELEVYCDHKVHKCRFEKGIIVDNMHVVGEYDEDITGTVVSFNVDEEIWADEQFDYGEIDRRMQQLAFLNSNLTYHVDIEQENYNKKTSYHYENGLLDYLNHNVKDKPTMLTPFKITKNVDDVDIDCVFTYVENKYDESINSFVNNIPTHDGGSHYTGFRHGVYRALNKYATDNDLVKTKLDISDYLEGFTGIIHVKVSDANFDSQGKSRLVMSKVEKAVKSLVEEEFADYLDKNPDVAKAIIKKAELAKKAKISAQKAREAVRKGKTGFEGKPNKFADCKSKNPEEAEIYLVEGE